MKFLLLLAAFPGALIAGPRTSAIYSIATDATEAGGRATSASYTHDGTTGVVVGFSNVVAPAQTAKHGYVGQLYDITGLVVNAAAPSVNETGTLQLGAWRLLDDATFLGVTPTEVNWSVVSGPITGISAVGVATAGVVFQNTPATVQGMQGGFTGSLNLTVLDTIADNFGAYAGDGLGDDWQVLHFGLDNPLAAPAENPDGDAYENRFEFIAGLDPTDPNSTFRLRIEMAPGQPGQRNLVFSPRLTDRTYVVKARSSLLTGEFIPLGSFIFSDNGEQRTVTDLDASGDAKFYRIEITKP